MTSLKFFVISLLTLREVVTILPKEIRCNKFSQRMVRLIHFCFSGNARKMIAVLLQGTQVSVLV